MKLCSWKKLVGVCVFGAVIALVVVALSDFNTVVETTGYIGLGRAKLNSIFGLGSNIYSSSQIQLKQTGSRHGFQRPLTFTNNTTTELPAHVVNHVETFVFFIGYPRSGHSIVGSLMDAHPHMIIAHEFMLFKQWNKMETARVTNGTKNKLRDKKYLFNALYRDSFRDATRGLRSQGKGHKGYTLEVGFPWQGRYNEQLLVIGDKSGGMATYSFMGNQRRFKNYYEQLLKTVNVPVRVIHVVRNPFDIISTQILFAAGKDVGSTKKASDFVAEQKALFKDEGTKLTAKKYKNEQLLENKTHAIFAMADAISRMSAFIGPDNILEIHNGELVNNPKGTLRKICTFLHVKCPLDYLEVAANKVYKTVSKTREIVEWPERLRDVVETKKQKFPFFSQYSFDSDV